MNALELLWHCAGGKGQGFHLLRFHEPEDSYFLPVSAPTIYAAMIEGQAWDRSPSVGLVPMVENGNYRLRADHASCLWARVETGESARRLGEFSPRPTLVLRDGKTCKRTALWALHSPLEMVWVRELNRRLQHRFCAPKKFAEPDFAVHPPGVVLRAGRSKPLEIVAELVGDGCYGAREVAGSLPQSPDPDAWAKANGRYVP